MGAWAPAGHAVLAQAGEEEGRPLEDPVLVPRTAGVAVALAVVASVLQCERAPEERADDRRGDGWEFFGTGAKRIAANSGVWMDRSHLWKGGNGVPIDQATRGSLLLVDGEEEWGLLSGLPAAPEKERRAECGAFATAPLSEERQGRRPTDLGYDPTFPQSTVHCARCGSIALGHGGFSAKLRASGVCGIG